MSGDGRLDLDDLGEVIDGATTLDEVVGEEHPTTWGERLESAGVTPWLRRHVAVVATVAAVVVAVGAVAWVRHDPRPTDDGLTHVAVVDSLEGGSAGAVEGSTPGVFAAIYTLVRQRPDDRVELLGISGPGIRATSFGRPVTDARDADRTSTPVVAVAGCEDPRVLTATNDQYRLLVRRTDAYGRRVEAAEPLPLGSNGRWDMALGGYCLQTLGQTRLVVLSVRATPDPARSRVTLDLRLRSTLGVEVAADVVGYAGTRVRPETTSVTIPSGTTVPLRVVESVQDCASPHLEGTLVQPDNGYGADGYGAYVEDRTLDLYLRVASQNPDAVTRQLVVSWSRAAGREVAAAFAAACSGLPSSATRVVSASPAPEPVRAAAEATMGGDTSTAVVRSVVDVRTSAESVAVADVLLDSDIAQGSTATIAAYAARSVDGVARVVVDWTTTCGYGSSPPMARLLLSLGGRTWPVRMNLDSRTVAEGLLRACPGLVPASLSEYGWNSLSPSASG